MLITWLDQVLNPVISDPNFPHVNIWGLNVGQSLRLMYSRLFIRLGQRKKISLLMPFYGLFNFLVPVL